jgi:error-prone DNA polymerase
VTPYAELQAVSNFSFLEGASHAHELVATAAALGIEALAVCDRNTLAGIVRAHAAAKEANIRLLIGARLDLVDGPSALCLPHDRAAYGRLSRLLTLGRRRAPKGECHLTWADVVEHAKDQILVLLPPDGVPDAGFVQAVTALAERYRGQCHLAASHGFDGYDEDRLATLAELAEAVDLPLVATNNVCYHLSNRRRLADVLTCIREHCTIDEAGLRLATNAERHLKSGDEMARLFARYPHAIEQSIAIAESCDFSLNELTYEYPDEVVPEDETPDSHLAMLTDAGARERYPDGVPAKVQGQLDHELTLIAELSYAPYFLTVHDIVGFARSRNILCQGRGSAANSAVCYCLGITTVDPDRHDVLFERFISTARDEPPDIDVDFEHERREEVIQYIYEKYGRERAGLTAVVIRYRGRSAIREVGKAMGLSLDLVAALAKGLWSFSRELPSGEQLAELGLNGSDRRLCLALDLAGELIGFPRHLSQHVGGFVITRGALSDSVPLENAAMENRTVIQWDKDDIDVLGMLKVDVLGLGMLTCIRKALALLAAHHNLPLGLADVPPEDPAVYDMLCRADSVGVFQVESRAQMSMLPRLKPRKFYDLVIEVAIVRPGPIQGDMVHPYLRRRNGEEDVALPSPELADVLGKTLGVPLFQEQAMRIAVVAADFTPNEADLLRRSMATFRKAGLVHEFHEKLVNGMVANDYPRDFAERCFKQIEGFGEYGFPESHAASFALLVYVSAWLKCHYPAAFAAAILNSQPMGFYAPTQLVRDAREHGVTVRPPDINASEWDCTLEPETASTDGVTLRLGLCHIKGLSKDEGARLVSLRSEGYRSIRELWQRSSLPATVLNRLAEADAFGSVGLTRRQALWAVKGLEAPPLPLFAAEPHHGDGVADFEPAVTLPAAELGEEVSDDYRFLRLSLKAHPLALLRETLGERGNVPAERLAKLANGKRVTVAGLVLVRQRPGTAKGVVFATLEDETGVANIIVWPPVFERYRRTVLSSRLLVVDGTLQREGLVTHIIAKHVTDLSCLLDLLAKSNAIPVASRDFH